MYFQGGISSASIGVGLLIYIPITAGMLYGLCYAFIQSVQKGYVHAFNTPFIIIIPIIYI